MWLGQHHPGRDAIGPWTFLTVRLMRPRHVYHRQRGRRHKKLTDWAQQMILQLRRWTAAASPGAGGRRRTPSSTCSTCCQSLAQPVTLIARLRVDAALYEPAPPRQPGRNGRPPLKGRRLTALKALLDLPTVSWVEVSEAWYNGATRTVELTSQTAVWYRLASRPCPCAGSWFGTPRANSPHRLCCALTWPWTRRRFWNGLCCAGNWRSPSGGASASGRGDPTPVVGSRHRPHHAS